MIKSESVVQDSTLLIKFYIRLYELSGYASPNDDERRALPQSSAHYVMADFISDPSKRRIGSQLRVLVYFALHLVWPHSPHFLPAYWRGGLFKLIVPSYPWYLALTRDLWNTKGIITGEATRVVTIIRDEVEEGGEDEDGNLEIISIRIIATKIEEMMVTLEEEVDLQVAYFDL